MDAVWLLNVLVDLMLLLLTKSLLRMHTRFRRIVVGAFVAALIVPISMYFPGSFFTTPLGKGLFSMVIIVCTFKIHSILHFLSALATFYFVTFVTGGGLIAMHFLFQQSPQFQTFSLLYVQQGYGEPVSWLFVIIGFPIVYYFTQFRMDRHVEEGLEYDQLCDVTIQLDKKKFHTKGFIDSGNQLVDPMTTFPVIICDHIFLQQWFTNDEWSNLQTAHETLSFHLIPKRWEKVIHVVPYQGVDGKRRFLIALRPEKVTIDFVDQQLATNKVLIGIQFGELTADETYHCLLHPYVMKKAPVQVA